MNEDHVLKEFVRERNEAMTHFVLTGDFSKVRAYCKKYGVEIPKNERTAQAGIYKAVQACTSIPQEVKDQAFIKCLKLGFNPLIKPYGYDDED